MGIKTHMLGVNGCSSLALKNLPTTWGLRQTAPLICVFLLGSEKPPHHMGIKTPSSGLNAICTQSSEKPPHHSGIIQR